MIRVLITLAVTAVVAAIAAALYVVSGVYDVAASRQHTAPVYWVLKANMRQSIKHRAAGLRVPPLDDAQLVARGRRLYAEQCVRCHGAPGVAPDSFALGLTPTPEDLAYTAREWPPSELFWTAKYGVKMTGMPAWEFRLLDEDLWAIVAYLKVLAHESPAEYAQAAPPAQSATPPAEKPVPRQPNAARGKRALHQYACITCHVIPGVVGATVSVGPPLEHIASRKFIAGLVPNTPENMVRWIRAPQEVHPGSAMPNLGVTERDARDINAFLSTLR